MENAINLLELHLTTLKGYKSFNKEIEDVRNALQVLYAARVKDEAE